MFFSYHIHVNSTDGTTFDSSVISKNGAVYTIVVQHDGAKVSIKQRIKNHRTCLTMIVLEIARGQLDVCRNHAVCSNKRSQGSITILLLYHNVNIVCLLRDENLTETSTQSDHFLFMAQITPTILFTAQVSSNI